MFKYTVTEAVEEEEEVAILGWYTLVEPCFGDTHCRHRNLLR